MADVMTRGAATSAADALGRLKAVYADRIGPAKAHYEAGGQVVGSIGVGLPIEVVMACGYMPTVIAPSMRRATPLADPWLNPTYDPQRRATLDQLLSGEVEFMQLVANVNVALIDFSLYHFAKELLRQGEGRKMPPLHQFSLLGHAHETTYAFGLEQTRALARRLRMPFGREPTKDLMAEAIAQTNAVRAELRELNALRRAGKISGVAGLLAASAARFMHPKDYAGVLKAARPSLAAPAKSGPRVMAICGWKCSDLDLHTVLEEAGMIVTAEDDAWGSRAAGPDIPLDGDLVNQSFRYHQRHTPNRGVYPASHRFRWVYDEAAKPDLDAVVFYMPPSDHALGWDYPRLQDFVEGHGKKTMVLRCDATTPEGREVALSTARAFIEKL